jgi:hypothetical protein
MIEDGRDLALMLALKYLMRRLEHKGVMSYPEIQRMLDEALGEVKKTADGNGRDSGGCRGRDHADRGTLLARLKGASRKPAGAASFPQSLRAVAVTPSVD